MWQIATVRCHRTKVGANELEIKPAPQKFLSCRNGLRFRLRVEAAPTAACTVCGVEIGIEDGAEPGYLPPDPDEPPPLELWSAVGDVPPWGTALLLLSWAVVFTLMAVRGELGDTARMVAWGASLAGPGADHAAWRLLASTFLHGGAAHVFFNAATMLAFGPTLERIFSRAGFALIYALGGLAASEASVLWRTWRDPDRFSVSVGASGAIFALGGGLLAAAFRLRHRLAPGRARALAGAMLFLLGQGLVAGVTRNGTDNAAHAAGLVAGGLLGLVAPLGERLGGPPTGWPMRVLGTLAALALIAAFAMALRGGLSG
jgi:membrane associated rhomboid family serine protease